MQRTVHIVGAGISGLSAAVRLAEAGCVVRVHEAAQQVGGRCRSYFDGATNLTIDNGNHLVLSGNQGVLAYARRIGTEAGLQGPPKAEFEFIDLGVNKRWKLQINDGRIPFWVFDANCRVPDTSPADYFALAPLIWANARTRVGDVIKCDGVLYRRLVLPLLLAALNIDPPDGAGGLAGAIIRETLLAGGQACRPLIARDGLSRVLIEPAVDYIRAKGGSVDVGHEVRRFTMANGQVTALALGDQTISLAPNDAVVVAVPPRSAAALLPGVSVPTKFRAIVNAHFRFVPPPHLPPMTGVVNGLIEWLFAFPDRLSITISGGDRLVDMPREDLARAIWKDICAVAGIDAEMPAWQIVRERRATFEASPEQNALRPGTRTEWKNLFLAGDWTDTGLPATIEGSVRSGNRAADHVLKNHGL
ncbi:MAG: amine oxidase [Nitrobacter sp.]|uniref:hydroxysqualene dehydroxylase HpnE n=1 Tax=Nitrobacter sp. TaxID=29420 RepID=UPI00387DF0FF